MPEKRKRKLLLRKELSLDGDEWNAFDEDEEENEDNDDKEMDESICDPFKSPLTPVYMEQDFQATTPLPNMPGYSNLRNLRRPANRVSSPGLEKSSDAAVISPPFKKVGHSLSVSHTDERGDDDDNISTNSSNRTNKKRLSIHQNPLLSPKGHNRMLSSPLASPLREKKMLSQTMLLPSSSRGSNRMAGRKHDDISRHHSTSFSFQIPKDKDIGDPGSETETSLLRDSKKNTPRANSMSLSMGMKRRVGSVNLSMNSTTNNRSSRSFAAYILRFLMEE
jgi:hypothetical protein